MQISQAGPGLFALVAAVTMANVPVAAVKQSTARDAAIRRCSMQAERLYPDNSQDVQQWDLYRACVTAAGFVP